MNRTGPIKIRGNSGAIKAKEELNISGYSNQEIEFGQRIQKVKRHYPLNPDNQTQLQQRNIAWNAHRNSSVKTKGNRPQ